jgi:acetyl esterase/lipase
VAAPETVAAPAVVYLHGGAFVLGGLGTHRRLVARISAAVGAPVLAVDYRMSPRASLADAVEDGLAGYRQALALGEGRPVALAGDSAGGWLVFAVAVAARRAGLPRPAGLVALSPWIDLTCAGHAPSLVSDGMLSTVLLRTIATRLLARHEPVARWCSPETADLEGLPPSMILVGSTELLLADAQAMASRLATAGVACHLQVWEDQPHVFPFFADVLPEGRRAIAGIGAFLANAVAH